MYAPLSATRPRIGARALLPREHGLWCWVSAPLLGALLLAPTPGAGLGVVSVAALFGAGNAVRADAWRPAGWATAASAAVGLAAVPLLPRPEPWLVALAALVVGGGLTLDQTGRAVGRQVRGHTRYELAAIGGFCAAGSAIAIAAGASVAAGVGLGFALAPMHVIGLWWVRGQLARVLPGREPWRGGVVAVAALVAATAAVALTLDLPALALLPALYALRARITRPAATGRDARRIGLSEAAWAAAATLLGAGIVSGVA